ncbi:MULTISPECIES: Cof-type HAD-IIB family hydrolase [Bacillus]|uniref:Cof-type HAD-IIB family hydrolase n=1 Tax=Bacillus TaxID=1386 RepID=UPI000BB902F7|nr:MULTISPECIES: Cof-type HAD-IIB family hydrolase [Bacillus]
MDKKVVFFDIDGTLLDHNKELPSSTKESIKQLQESGVYVAIATGRAPFMYEDLRKELGIETFVSFNGQYVVFEGEVIYTNPLSKERLIHLTDFSRKKEHPLIFMNEETMKANVNDHSYIHESLGSLKFVHPEQHPHFYNESEIYQTLLFCEEPHENIYQENYKEFHFIRWHEYSTDILPFGGSKAIGIQRMMEKMNIPKEHVYAFGDGLNDLEMLSFVGTGVAMGNSHQELKKVANIITKDVSDNGIQHGLELVGLIK